VLGEVVEIVVARPQDAAAASSAKRIDANEIPRS